MRATDPTGLVAQARTAITVTNVAPSASFANTSGRIAPGQSAALAFDDQTDPGAADVAAGYLYSYDCDGDDTFEVGPQAAPIHSCFYAASGTFTARGRIEDKDGAFTDYSAVVPVATPREGIDLLIQLVDDLVAGGALDSKPAGKLLHQLAQAVKHLDKGQPGPTINQLRHFIRDVEDLVASGQLPAADGQELIAAASWIITALGG